MTNLEAARQVFDAAVRTFSVWGFHGTTTRKIAEEAGVSRGAVYLYYPSKEALLFDICIQGHQAVLTELGSIAAEGGAPPERLSKMTYSLALDHAQNHRRALVAHSEFAALTPEHLKELVGLRQGITRLMREAIDHGLESGDFVTDNPHLTCLAIQTLSIDVCRWYHEEGYWSADDIAEHFSDLALRMVGAKAAR